MLKFQTNTQNLPKAALAATSIEKDYNNRSLCAGDNLAHESKSPAQEAWLSLIKLHGFSAIPNVLFDYLRGILGRNEYDVFMYILRRTVCFHKLSDAISMSQFQNGIVTISGKRLDYGCGIKGAETITKAIKELERLGFILKEHKVAANGGAMSNTFTICPEVILQTINSLEEGRDAYTVTDSETPLEELPAKDNGAEVRSVIRFPSLLKRTSETEQITHPECKLEKLDTVKQTGSYPELEEGLPEPRVDKTIDFQKESQKKRISTMGVYPLVDYPFSGAERTRQSNTRTEIDVILLSGLGFDKANSLRLSLLAEKTGKEDNYIAQIVDYCQKYATTNPAGMARRLIEKGEERSWSYSSTKRQFNSDRFTTQNKLRNPLSYLPTDSAKPSRIINLPEESAIKRNRGDEATNPSAEGSNSSVYQPKINLDSSNLPSLWEAVCQSVAGRLGRPDLADLLTNMSLLKTEVKNDELICVVAPAYAWQLRLITATSVALIELALRQHLGQPAKLRFENVDNPIQKVKARGVTSVNR